MQASMGRAIAIPAGCSDRCCLPHPALLCPAGVSAYTAQGAVLSVCPGRVAYHHGLKGAAVAVDTACSSSLVALNSGAGPGCLFAGGWEAESRVRLCG